MQGAWQGVRAGWWDVRGMVYFVIILPLFLVPAAVLSYLFSGELMTPSPIAWFFASGAALVSIVFAALLDGPTGRLGRYAWAVVLLAVVWHVLRELSRAIELPQEVREAFDRQTRVKFAGHMVRVVLRGESGKRKKKVELIDISRTIRRQLWAPAEEGGERGVLIAV